MDTLAMETNMTFKSQAETFLQTIQTRRRNPVRFGTIRAYRSHLQKSILPCLGDLPLSKVENGVLKTLVARLSERKLSPASINAITSVVKQVVASAVDLNGNELYPRTWNNDFVDMPVVRTQDQDAPTIAVNRLERALGRANGQDKALYALLAGTGLRIGEALTLMVGEDDGVNSFWIRDSRIANIRTTVVDGKIQPATKTQAGQRQVDLSQELNDFLTAHITVKSGLMFPDADGGLMVFSTAYRHLQRAGVTEGFHSFRRFRITHLESQNVPKGLQMFWTGHAANDVHESYIKMGENLTVRKDWAQRAGLGFSLEAA